MRSHLPVSRLGFGCASVMGKVDRRTALHAMDLAFEYGVRHFDIARSYGFGYAEQVLGEFVKNKRDQVTITSKFGVVPPELTWKKRYLMPVARKAMKVFPGIRQRVKGHSRELLAEKCFDAAYARNCLEHSLRSLQTDYLDFYLLHEPGSSDQASCEALRDFFEAAVQAGKIKRWGIAYQYPADHAWAAGLGGDIVQFEGNFSTVPQCPPLLTDLRQHFVTRPFGGGAMDSFLPVVEARIPGVRLKLGEMGFTFEDFALGVATHMAGVSGTVIASMYSPAHIRSNCDAISRIKNSPEIQNMISGYFNGIA